MQKSVDIPGSVWYSNRALQTGAELGEAETLRGTTDLGFCGNRHAQRAPCKLNNVKTKKDTRRGRKFFSSERLLGKGTEQDFFEAKS